MSACTVPRTVDSALARNAACSSAFGARFLSAVNCSICWSIAVFMNIARIIGAGPLIVIDTEVVGAHRSKPEYRSEEHTSELQSLMRISYAVFCLKKKTYTSTKYKE